MIRLATLDDANEIIKIGIQFHKESGLEPLIPLDISWYSISVRKMIRAPDADIVVLDLGGIKGAAALVTQRCFFNKDHIMGVEQFFWIYPEYRGRHGKALMEGLEQRAKIIGCSTITMVTLQALKPEATGRFYVKNGYTPLEHAYVKSL